MSNKRIVWALLISTMLGIFTTVTPAQAANPEPVAKQEPVAEQETQEAITSRQPGVVPHTGRRFSIR